MSHHHSIPRSALLLTLLTYFCFSSFDATSRYLMLHLGLPQAQVMALVMAFGLIPIFVMVHLRGEWKTLKPTSPKLVLARAALACLEVWLVFQTFQALTMAESYALFFTVPLWVMLLGSLFLKEKIGPTQKLALLIGFIGALVATNPSFETLSIGQLTGLGAAFCGGCGMIMMRHLGKTERNGTILIAFFAGQVIFNFMLSREWAPLSPAAFGLIALAGLLEGTAHSCLLLALQRAPAALVAPFQYSQILWALVFGLLVFNEPPTLYTMAGLAIITLAGLILMQRKKRPQTV